MNWKQEARRLLAEAAGTNDNRAKGGGDVVFHAPVTVNVFSDGALSDQMQRLVLVERLRGFMAAEANGVAEAFAEQLQHAFGKTSVDDLDTTQLQQLLAEFAKLIKAARIFAAGNKR